MRIFVATLRKLVRRPASFLTLGFVIALLSLILLAVSVTASRPGAGPEQRSALALVTFPEAYTVILSFILGLGGLFAVIYSATVAGSEWTWGTLKSAVARGESRSRYQLLSFAAIALMVGIGLIAALAVGVGVAVVGASIAGVSTAGLGDSKTLAMLPELLGRGWLAIVEEGALGFAIATLARSSVAGIGGGIAFFFGEDFATILAPDVVRYLPFNAANAVVVTPGEGGVSFGFAGASTSALDPSQALIVVTAWLVGTLAVAALVTERAEISG